MDSSREESPDWLRTFQAPTNSILTLSSDSSPNDSPSREDRIDEEELSRYDSSQLSEKDKNQDIVLDEKGAESHSNKISKAKSAKKCLKVTNISPQKKKTDNRKKRKADGADREVVEEVKSEKHIEPSARNNSIWTLSSDSESCPENSSLKEDHIHCGESSQNKDSKFQERGKDKDGALFSSGGESPIKKASKEKSAKKKLKVEDHSPRKEKKIYHHEKRKVSCNGAENGDDVEVGEEEISEKHIEPHVSSSRLPLVLSEKVHRSKALVECEGESIDLSGDMGAVGRIVISDAPSGNHEMYLDLKGTIYKTTIVPSRTFCVVSFGQSEAKIETIMNDFIQLKPQSNVYEAETMVEGTLDGFSFDSEDEAEKIPKAISHQTDQNEGLEEQTNRKGKGKAEKASRVVRKKGKTAGGKSQPTKKVRKKTQVSKKSKPKK